jgi:tetratricopeptide (TPR) repeat protein
MTAFFKHTFRQSCLFLTIIFVLTTGKLYGSAQDSDINKAREQFKTGLYTQCIESARKAIANGAFERDLWILKIESQMELGLYKEAAMEIDTALLHHPYSIRLLKLGHTANLYNNRNLVANQMLSRIYRAANTRTVEGWDGSEVVALGQALLTLGAEPKTIMDYFYNRTQKTDPNCRQAYLAAAELAMDKQDFELAADKYRQALERFGDDPDIHCGLAGAFYYSDRNAMLKSLDAALFINPNHVPSLLLLAEHQIDCEDYETARKTLNRIIAVNPWQPEAWAYRCILAHISNDPIAVEKTRATALKYWSTNPKVDYLIGLKLSQKYRFADGEKYQRQVLEFDPGYLPAKIQLAQDLLRLGYESEGWALAEQVYNKDAYNVQAYNLINLRDHLANFKTLRQGRFIVRMEQREAAAYGQSVLELLMQAELELCDKYDFKLDRPVTLELFPDQQDFAVRTFGIPGGDGFLGVCFGNVITANSPKAEHPSNWNATLWHEFCHVVTLNMTRNKMPRWLSEGISVYEEVKKNPTWGQQMNPQYRKMILEGQLTPIGNLSGAFLNPKTPMHLQFAYYQSCIVVEFIVEKYGYDSLKAILVDLANGVDVYKAISEHAEPLDKIEKEFEAFARKRAENLAPQAEWGQSENRRLIGTDSETLAEWLNEHPNNIRALTLYAKSLFAKGEWEQAKEPLKKMIELYPEYVGEDNGYQLLAEAYRNLDQTEQERRILEKLAEISCDSIYAYERLMEIAFENENWQEVVKNGQRYMAVHPMLTKLHWQLGRAYEELGNDDKAIESYRRLLSLDFADPAELNYRLGRLLEEKDPATAKRHVLTALAEAPRFRRAHKLLLEIIEKDAPIQNMSESDNQSKAPTIQEDVQ